MRHDYFIPGEIDAETIRQSVVGNLALADQFSHITTLESENPEGFNVSVFFTQALEPDQKNALDSLISNYTYEPPPPPEEANLLPDHPNSQAAIAAGMKVGDFFRTGERLKQVIHST